MGGCQCVKNALSELNLDTKREGPNLVFADDDPEKNNMPTEDKVRATNQKNDMRRNFKSLISGYGKSSSADEFNRIIPEKYLQYSLSNPYNNQYDGDLTQLIEEGPVRLTNGNYYWGSWNEKIQMCGPGKLYSPPDKVFVEGIWRNGLINEGRILLPDDSVYEGEIQDGLYHGEGKITYADGRSYEGTFKNGMKDGKGSLYFPDGSKYWGEFKNDQFHGDGNFLWCGGYEYRGDFKNNTIDGKGTLKQVEGSSYTGEFKRNEFHGKGKFVWKSGERYDGHYVNGIKEGKGTYTMNNDAIYKGGWSDNIQHGIGSMENETEECKGFWRNGHCIEKTLMIRKDKHDSHYDSNGLDLNFTPILEDINPLDLPYLDHNDPIIKTEKSFLANIDITEAVVE